MLLIFNHTPSPLLKENTPTDVPQSVKFELISSQLSVTFDRVRLKVTPNLTEDQGNLEGRGALAEIQVLTQQ